MGYGKRCAVVLVLVIGMLEGEVQAESLLGVESRTAEVPNTLRELSALARRRDALLCLDPARRPIERECEEANRKLARAVYRQYFDGTLDAHEFRRVVEHWWGNADVRVLAPLEEFPGGELAIALVPRLERPAGSGGLRLVTLRLHEDGTVDRVNY